MSSYITAKAQLVASNMEKEGTDKVVAFDPMTILIIIQLIMGLLKLMEGCNFSPSAALKAAKNPNLVQRFMIKRIALDKMGRKKFNEIGDSVINGIKEVAAVTTLDEVKLMYQEV